MKIRLKLGSVPELFVEPNINIVRDCIGGLVIMYLFYICNCLNLKPSVSNVAKAEHRSVLDQPNGNAVVIDFFQDHIMRDVDISKKTVVDWFSFCREVCVKIMIRQHEAA
ncbi:hypothetical protein KUF71_024315 [Frankliniella fusca]|nr:hypothetical protein KUF71_024315 [Frankliniella fusca]